MVEPPVRRHSRARDGDRSTCHRLCGTPWNSCGLIASTRSAASSARASGDVISKFSPCSDHLSGSFRRAVGGRGIDSRAGAVTSRK